MFIYYFLQLSYLSPGSFFTFKSDSFGSSPVKDNFENLGDEGSHVNTPQLGARGDYPVPGNLNQRGNCSDPSIATKARSALPSQPFHQGYLVLELRLDS